MSKFQYADLFFDTDIAEVDPTIDFLIQCEEDRQARCLIMIPSESMAPKAVLQALGSPFNNVYAEGYPSLRMIRDPEPLLLDFGHQLAYYRRYADRRFYKGVEYVDFVESLARRRCAEAFANDRVSADEIFVNIQPLSGAAANLAVYDALLNAGDTIMGMNLFQGGHLTHGSEFNISGRRYKVVSYGVSRTTERLDYDEIMRLAEEHRPRLIVAGYTSYPWAPDWEKFREIADAVGAYLMADIAHTAGMAVAGVYPNPVGIADVVTFTTHKTLCGPRGACILTTDEELANKVDMAVFPGAQGGPHPNKFAALAVMFQIARTEEFRDLQRRIVQNAKDLAAALQAQGLRLVYGGTDTHLLVVDCRSVKTPTGYPLYGEIPARVLDLCGIVVNRNTIPGDELTVLGSGIRLGTPWVTQRGMGKPEMEKIAELIARALHGIYPVTYYGLAHDLPRGKIDLELLEEIQREVAALASQSRRQGNLLDVGYPHHLVIPANPPVRTPMLCREEKEPANGEALLLDGTDQGVLLVSGARAKPFLQGATTRDIASLAVGQGTRTFLLDADGKLIDDLAVVRLESDEFGRDRYLVVTNPAHTERVKSWLRGLSDGYIVFDRQDYFRKIEGPVTIDDLAEVKPEDRLTMLALHGTEATKVLHSVAPKAAALPGTSWFGSSAGVEMRVVNLPLHDATGGEPHFMLFIHPEQARTLWTTLQDAGAVPAGPLTRQALRTAAGLPTEESDNPRPDGLTLYRNGHASWFRLSKSYFVGEANLHPARSSSQRPEWHWEEPTDAPLKRSCLYEEHKKLTRKIVPFAGWEMPVWYTGVSEEHQAVRQAAGLFDVSHMGVFEVAGEHAASFLDLVCTNYIRWLEDGQSCYAYFLDPDGHVIDDLMVYRRRWDKFLLVVNAANADKDWDWLNAINEGRVLIDREHPDKTVEGRAIIRNLKEDRRCGSEMRADLALQGPRSIDILQALTDDPQLKRRLRAVRRTELIEVELAGFDLVIARTGYTGEEWGYEIFVHPDRAPELWNLLLEVGEPFGLKPAGLAARDSTRTEAGLPLYGHELAGPLDLGPVEAGFASYVKVHKPYFIGRSAFLKNYRKQERGIARFRMDEKGVRTIHPGAPVVNRRGRVIGQVTSAVLVEGYQMGMACIELRYHKEGEKIGIVAVPPKVPPAKAADALQPGDEIVLYDWATILPRFPRRE